MEVSNGFKQAIADYLQVRANTDTTFACQYMKPNKSLDECCNYILQRVKESGYVGMDDDEVYGLAVDYYDEDNIDAKYLKPIHGKVVVNHHEEAKPVAPKPVKTAKPVKKDNTQQLTLF